MTNHARRCTIAVAGAALLATAGCTLVSTGATPTATDDDSHVTSVLGRNNETCTSPKSAPDAVFGEILRTAEGEVITLEEVTLRNARNLRVVDARAIAITAADGKHHPVATDRWPTMSTAGTWWWTHAATTDEPRTGDVHVLYRVRRPDPTRDASAEGALITYTSDGGTRTLDNNHTIRIQYDCLD